MKLGIVIDRTSWSWVPFSGTAASTAVAATFDLLGKPFALPYTGIWLGSMVLAGGLAALWVRRNRVVADAVNRLS